MLSIRDELRLLYLKHAPLGHVRITSPVEKTRSDWQELSKRFAVSKKYSTYISQRQGLLGVFKFSGSASEATLDLRLRNGYPDFLKVCHRIGMLLYQIPIASLSAKAKWMDIVHDTAELNASPILTGTVYQWDDFCFTEREEMRSRIGPLPNYESDELSEEEADSAYFQPVVSVLDTDVFRASAAAIDLLLDPELYFVWRRYKPEIMPVDLANLITQCKAFVPSSLPQEQAKDAEITTTKFLFARSGEIWHLRFQTTDGVETGNYKDTKGLNQFFRLLQSGSKGLTALELSPMGSEADEESPRAVIDSDEIEFQSAEGEFSGLTRLGGSYLRVDIEDVLNEIESLKSEIAQLESESQNTALIKQLKQDLRAKEKELKRGISFDPRFQPAYKAFNRVKISLLRTRNKIQEDMPRLSKFLEDNVVTSGFGWRYTPSQPVQWSFEEYE